MRTNPKRWAMALLVLLGAAAAADAAGPASVRKQVEASMLVTGHVLIERDGSVSRMEIDDRGELPEPVVGLVEKSMPGWRFEPVVVDGEAIRGRARMSLRVIAKRLDGGDYELSIRSGHFGAEAWSPEERQQRGGSDVVRSVDMRPPGYPQQALAMNAQGTVYLVLRIDRAGGVEDVVTEQVNLRTVGSESEMSRMRKLLADAALGAARKWAFRPPTTGESADDPFWSVRVPVDFNIGGVRKQGVGKWEAYVPGPRQKVPWSEGGLDASQSPDALIAGEVHQIGRERLLLTPLQGG